MFERRLVLTGKTRSLRVDPPLVLGFPGEEGPFEELTLVLLYRLSPLAVRDRTIERSSIALDNFRVEPDFGVTATY